MNVIHNNPTSHVLCDECGTDHRVLVSVGKQYLCLDCVRQINKTVAIWRKEQHAYILANSHRLNAKVLDDEPHQVIEPHETSSR